MNQIIITGNVGKNPEKGQYDVHFTVATTRTWKNRNGEQQEKTVWHNVSYLGKAQDDVMSIKKGDRVCIIGEQDNGSFTKQDGSHGSYTQISTFEIYVQPKACHCQNDLPNNDLPDFMR